MKIKTSLTDCVLLQDITNSSLQEGSLVFVLCVMCVEMMLDYVIYLKIPLISPQTIHVFKEELLFRVLSMLLQLHACPKQSNS